MSKFSPKSLVNVLVPPLRQPLTYGVPDDIAHPEIGQRVEVPLGGRIANGFVIEGHPDPSSGDDRYQIKPIRGSLGSGPCFSSDQLSFFRWVADYYGDSLSNVIDAAVPKGVPAKFRRFLVLKDPAAPASKAGAKLVEALREAGGSLEYSMAGKKVKGLAQVSARLAQSGAIEILSEEIVDQHISREAPPVWAKADVSISGAQRNALEPIGEAVSARRFETFLLHGVTGSGKTEIYIEAIKHARALGIGALVVVPEIALTPQLVDRFRARLGNQLATLHSGLPPRVRWDSWRALLEGRNHIAIGARSAIFAPVPNLGLIIVDEEHDSSYKQSDGLRYNARDLATVRGKLSGCAVVLGSATPSLETFYNAASKRYRYLRLSERHAAHSKLQVEVVDLTKVKPWEMKSENISPALHAAVSEALSRSEQVFLLYNRRGFASFLQCEACGKAIECSNCSVTMTYHQHSHSLLCHYCNLAAVPLEYCPVCNTSEEARSGKAHRLVQRGAGTEKIFEEVQELFPGVTVDRLDRDSVGDGDEYRNLLARVRSGETSILVGTQMIAKGHDLPGVTLVGIVDCDVGLHMPDFRAGERVFQLLTQAGGRAGRGDRKGRVVLQTRVPGHPSIVKTVENDFPGFAKGLLAERKDFGYPPFSRLLRIVASSADQALAQQMLDAFRARILELCEKQGWDVRVLGPVQAPLAKLKTQYRWHLLLKSSSGKALNSIMNHLQAAQTKTTRCKISYDMDPQDLL